MNSAGTRIVAGGPGAGSATGTVRIFELSGGAWVAVGAPITAPYGFGYAVSMSDDGNRIAVGQPSGLGTNGPGYTYVYEWAASAWTQLGSGIAGPHADARAGAAVALAGDGNMLVVGAPLGQGLPDPGGFGCNSSWVQRYDLVGGVASPVGSPTGHYLCTGNDYSLQVSVSSDGNRLLSGGDTGLYAELIGGAWQVRKNWNLRSIVPAISPDGQTAVLGTPGHDASRGQVLLYALP
jgi:hypothetical protein